MAKKTGLSLKNIYYTCCERVMVHLQQREVNIDEAKLTLQGLRQHYVYPWRCWGSTRWHQYSCHRLSNPLFFSYPWSHTLLKLLNILIIKYTGEQGVTSLLWTFSAIQVHRHWGLPTAKTNPIINSCILILSFMLISNIASFMWNQIS